MLFAGALGILAAQDDGGGGRRCLRHDVVEHHSNEMANQPHSMLWGSNQASSSGPIRVELPDRQLLGTARLSFSFAAQMDGDQLRLFRNWGEV